MGVVHVAPPFIRRRPSIALLLAIGLVAAGAAGASLVRTHAALLPAPAPPVRTIVLSMQPVPPAPPSAEERCRTALAMCEMARHVANEAQVARARDLVLEECTISGSGSGDRSP